jgi:hypothetical protein
VLALGWGALAVQAHRNAAMPAAIAAPQTRL